jgi:FkbM family methyltransferase
LNRLNRIVRRGRKALSQYGFLRTPIYAAWAIICHPKLKIPSPFRNKIPRALASLFQVLGIHSIPVIVNDVKLYIDPRNGWSLREYALKPSYDLRAISAVRRFVPNVYTFIDVGANVGVWSFSLATHFSRVLAVEPDTRCYECCQRTRGHSRLSNVDVVNTALADHDGNGVLFPCASHIGDSRTYNPGDADRLSGTPVKLMSFDSLVSQHHVNIERMFIKLDAQGSEPWILQGMRQSLSQAKDVVLYTEIQQAVLVEAGSSIDSYLALLGQLGFMPVDLFKGLNETNWEDVLDSRTVSKDYCFRLSN